ncbi:MAG: T9SS type A sorting domain-containing protein [Bacteroidales bacterium]|nr:T9SS type A sorting domain-containing protein [Bacteroidales bacterium]
MELPSDKNTIVEIFDINGRRCDIITVSGSTEFDISNYSAGTYIVRANGRNKVVVKE